MSNNDEFCIENEKHCIKNEELCIKNVESCIKNDGFCSYNHCDEEIDDEERRRRGPSSVVTPRQFILSELMRSRGGLRNGKDSTAHATALRDLNGCWGLYDATTAYLNRDVTRTAIHVRSNHEEELAYGPGGGGGWGLCGMRGAQYDRDETASLLPLYPSLVAKLRVLIFSGDNDACVPYIGSQAWTSELAESNGWDTAQPWHPWLVDKQVGGYVTVYTHTTGHDFTFATVYNAGHMVPEDKPKEALALFKRFTYPAATGDVAWNPTPTTPLHIVAGENQVDPVATSLPPFLPTKATEVMVPLGLSFTTSVQAAGGYTDDASGPQLYVYQWVKDGVDIAESHAKTLEVASMAHCDVGVYVCIVATLDGDTVASQPIYLAVGFIESAPQSTAERLQAMLASPQGQNGLLWVTGLLVGLLLGCLTRGCCIKKKKASGYRVMSTEEE